jgi:hypothetical protein
VKRRTAVLLGWTAAASATGLVVALSAALAAERGDQRDRYRAAVVEQRRAAGQPAAPATRELRAGARPLCVRGAAGFASAAGAALGRGARRSDGTLDAEALAQVSSAAVEAERWAELAMAGPALPQRMGLGADGQPLAPATRLCDGAPAFGEAHVVAPGAPAITVSAEPAKATAKTKASPAKPKPKKPAR